MPITVRRGKVLGDITYEIERLDRLSADLKRLAAGDLPTAEDLADAPLLENYVQAQRPMLCLLGICHDHPRLHGPVVVTTDIWIMAPDYGWCRTLGRYYRLGSPRDGGEVQ